MIKAIMFDMMGVIFKVGDDTNDLLVPFVLSKSPKIPKQKIIDLYIEASLGRISAPIFWKELGLSAFYPEIESEYLNNYLEFDEEIVPCVESLSKKFKLGILSNDVSEWSEYLRKRFNLDSRFECSIISGNVGIRKPDKRIYEIASLKMNVKPEECVFIDDRIKNTSSAREIGMKTILFKRDTMENLAGHENGVEMFSQISGVLNQIENQDSH
jgi:HAD superfamily hydrolase (TIGR01509 family)